MIQKQTQVFSESRVKILLTKREKQVLNYLAMGNTDLEIGKQLYLSHETIKTYRTNLLRKFDANNSCHLVFLASKYITI